MSESVGGERAMSESAQGGRVVSSQGGRVVASPAATWRVRAAVGADTSAVAGAVHQLLRELGGTPPPLIEMEKTVRELIGDPATGALFVAEDDGATGAGEHGVGGPLEHGAIVGVLGASWQTAIHVPGRYALIQDLWVASSHRGQAIGRALLEALLALAREQGMARVEVGLPRESFAAIRATEAFYLDNGFAPLGARMRRLLS
jgi:GNAT superfamily N-acetyltransferase